MVPKLTSEQVRENLYFIKEKIKVLEDEYNWNIKYYKRQIEQIQHLCPHENTYRTFGTPYDPSEVYCEDCGKLLNF